MGSAKVVEFYEATGRELRALSRGRRVGARLKQRADVVLMAAEDLGNSAIAATAVLERRQVAISRQRFLAGRVDALRQDAPRSGRPATVDAEMRSRV